MMSDIEGVSQSFNLETYMDARKVARRISLLCASHIEPGMSEEDGQKVIDNLFKMHEIKKTWHPTKFRIGKNTTKSFREKSEPDHVLQEEDIYFLDIGPVVNGHEADIGHTFSVGQNLKFAELQKTVKEIFLEVQEHWKKNEVSGVDLYKKAKEITESKGYVLNEKMAGHRLGDFPHALFYKGKLSDFEKTPINNLWVLEIHILTQNKDYGAFYEDILIK